ncbi:flagellar basal body L-ring protein FlgH [Pelagicoccus sp. SDUM812003]|uniref:flagellar basal body L-ring protein FlgH n=1 Tax=Pelagicoccus sp. SDUM812003 TaxID=3041267 RepID=UPI00280C9E6B|nr:flagellar basal body L-ring protein FlgH [Pelagicoccus sp. SDUM812003]MDQ8202557.1 flagellar basal body L-ring protein FlgH [Pelagicoccus sp. SDUM812003]
MRISILLTLVLAFAATGSAKSLWTSKKNNEAGMYADRLATRIGDILMVQIDEETIVNRSSSKNTSSTTNVSHGLSSLVIPNTVNVPDPAEGGADLPKIAFSPTDSFSGTGSVADSNVIEAKIAVLVVDVLPNGNLVIEGARKMETSKETQYIVMRGIVRGDDVSTNNTVMSYNVVNASIEVIGDGELMTAQRKGWINQLLDAVNVF